MPYPAGHRPEMRKKIIDSARKLFNRHGFDNVSLKQIMSGAGLTHGGSTAISEARAICTPKYSDASLRTRNGKAAGKVSMWICPQPM
jgi:Bacterial regulatory proteins, tetR family